MAYTIKYGDSYLFYPGSDTALAHDAKLSQRAGAAYSTFTFTIPADNPLYTEIALHDVDNPIVLAYDDTELFRGVVTGIERGLWLEKTITCADELVFLDWVQTRYKPFGKTASGCLAELIAIYNSYARLKDAQGLDRFLFTIDVECLTSEYGASSVGYVNPRNTSQRIVDCETSTPTSILQIIKRTMVDDYGAFLRVSYIQPAGTGKTPYRAIGLFSQAPDENTQVIRLGENLIDYDYSATDEGMYNACLPIGGTMDTEADDDNFAQLSIAIAVGVGADNLTIATDKGTAHLYDGCYLSVGDGMELYQVVGDYDVGTSVVNVRITPHAMSNIPQSTEVNYAYRLHVDRNSMIDSTTVALVSDGGTVNMSTDDVLLFDGGLAYTVLGNYSVGQTAVNVGISPRAVYSIPANLGVTYVGKNPYYHDKALTLNRLTPHTIGSGDDTYYCDTEIVYNVADAQRYGIKCMTYRDSNIKDANALLNKAIAMIEPCRKPKTSLTVTAVDAAYYGDYVHLQAGQRVRVVSEPHELDETMYVVSAEIDLQNPENTRYQLGTIETTLSRMVRENGAAIDDETSNSMIELDNVISTATIGALS